MTETARNHIAYIGPFTEDQLGYHREACSFEANRYPSVDKFLHSGHQHSTGFVVVRGGVSIPSSLTTEHGITHVISAGTGTGNIESVEGRQIYSCPGANAREVAIHGFMMALNSRTGELYTRPSVGIIGSGNVGSHLYEIASKLRLDPIIFSANRDTDLYVDDGVVLTNELTEVLDRDLIFIAAGKEVITQQDVKYVSFDSTVILLGRATDIEEAAYQTLRTQGNNVVIMSDVWRQEPNEGEEFPEITALEIIGDSSHSPVRGTMHSAARYKSASLRAIEMVLDHIDTITADSDPIQHPDPLLSLAKRLRSEERWKFERMGESPECQRVEGLMNALNKIAGKVISGESVIWRFPQLGTITPAHFL